jgi:hypothetical protein
MMTEKNLKYPKIEKKKKEFYLLIYQFIILFYIYKRK